jgi:malate dehydrogenase
MTTRIAIVGGGGGVGSSLAFNLLLRPQPYAVALVDGESGRARSHAMDLQLVLAAGATGSVRVVGLDEITSADVVVMCAAVPQRPNTSRMVDLRRNAAILGDVVRVLAREPDWPGVLLVVTNPVDVLVTWARRRTGLPRERVLGYTANDGLRLRSAVAAQLGVAAGAVDAWVIGEHGDGCVPLLDRVTVDGAPVALSADQRAEAAAFVRDWYVRHVALDPGRSSTWTSGHGVARMVAALMSGAPQTWPASVVLEGEYGASGVALGVPVDLGPGGVARVHEWPLSADEMAAMAAAARVVGDAASGLDGRDGPDEAGG